MERINSMWAGQSKLFDQWHLLNEKQQVCVVVGFFSFFKNSIYFRKLLTYSLHQIDPH